MTRTGGVELGLVGAGLGAGAGWAEGAVFDDASGGGGGAGVAVVGVSA